MNKNHWYYMKHKENNKKKSLLDMVKIKNKKKL